MKSTEPLHRRVLARKKCRTLSGTQDTAMTGVAVMLLIVVMMGEAVQIHHSGFPLDRAATEHPIPMPGANREDAIKVFITRDGAIHFGHTAIGIADVADQVRHKVRDGSERRVYLVVDQRAKYGDAEAVVDAIRGGGIWNIGLIVDQDRRED